MKIKFIILIFFGIAKSLFGQNVNLIIEVNQRLVIGEIGGAYLNFENKDGTESKNLVGYYPGELVLEPEVWEKINSKSTKKISLTFDFYGLKGRYHNSVKFEIEIQKYQFNQRYLILRIYDFRESKFKKQYGCLTDKEYIAELNFPQGGILVKCR